MYTKITILLCLLLGVACMPTEITPENPLSEIPIVITRPTMTATLRPGTPTLPPTQALTPILLPTPTRTHLPTYTPRPTSTPHPTNTPSPDPLLPSHYDLPPWVNDPNIPVLAFLEKTIDNYKHLVQLTLLNVLTREQYDLSLPNDSRNITWGQDEQGVYFQYQYYKPEEQEHQGIALIITWYYYDRVYIATGEIVRFDDRTSRYRGSKSPNGQFGARFTNTDPKKLIIENLETGDIITSTFSFDGADSSLYTHWSLNSNLIGVEHFYSVLEDSPRMSEFIIFTLQGEVFRRYYDFGYFTEWSPVDSNVMLYSDWIESDGLFYRTPCILEIQTSNVKCLTEIVTWQQTQSINIAFFAGEPQWLFDGGRIGFIWWINDQEGGVCTIDILTQAIECPITPQVIRTQEYMDYYGDDPAYIVRYQWSPDGGYMVLEVDTCGLECDDRTMTSLVTIRNDGSHYHFLGVHSFDYAWRPELQP